MRSVSGENGRRHTRPRRRPTLRSRASGAAASSGSGRPIAVVISVADVTVAGGSAGSAVAVSIADAIKRFDMGEIAFYRLKFFPQPLDVAVDRAVVDIDVFAICRVHQLVAAIDMPGTVRQRLQNQKLGHRQFDMLIAPGAQVPS